MWLAPQQRLGEQVACNTVLNRQRSHKASSAIKNLLFVVFFRDAGSKPVTPQSRRKSVPSEEDFSGSDVVPPTDPRKNANRPLGAQYDGRQLGFGEFAPSSTSKYIAPIIELLCGPWASS